MPDPLTIGVLVAGALAAGANGAASEAAKDAYKWLKAKLADFAAGDVAALEASPDSPARAAVVAEIVDGRPAPEQAELKALAEALAAALKAEGHAGATLNQFHAYDNATQYVAQGNQYFGATPERPERK